MRRRLLRFALFFVDAKRLGAGGTLGELVPGGFGTPATLAHMVERCRVASSRAWAARAR